MSSKSYLDHGRYLSSKRIMNSYRETGGGGNPESARLLQRFRKYVLNMTPVPIKRNYSTFSYLGVFGIEFDILEESCECLPFENMTPFQLKAYHELFDEYNIPSD